MFKALLQLQQQQRTVSGVLLDVFVIPAEAPEVEALNEQGRRYHELVQSTDPAQRALVEGPPHIYIYGSLLRALLERGDSIGAATAKFLRAHHAAYEEMVADDRCELVRVCRLDRTWKAETKKIQLHLTAPTVRQNVLAALRQAGAEHKRGRPQAGGLERELQGWLAALGNA